MPTPAPNRRTRSVSATEGQPSDMFPPMYYSYDITTTYKFLNNQNTHSANATRWLQAYSSRLLVIGRRIKWGNLEAQQDYAMVRNLGGACPWKGRTCRARSHVSKENKKNWSSRISASVKHAQNVEVSQIFNSSTRICCRDKSPTLKGLWLWANSPF